MAIRLLFVQLAAAAIAYAQSAVVTIEASHGGAGTDLTNTTITVPLDDTYTNPALEAVSTLYVTGATDVALDDIVCVPYRFADGTGNAGLPFTYSTPSLLSTNTVEVGSLVCLSVHSRNLHAALDLVRRAAPTGTGVVTSTVSANSSTIISSSSFTNSTRTSSSSLSSSPSLDTTSVVPIATSFTTVEPSVTPSTLTTVATVAPSPSSVSTSTTATSTSSSTPSLVTGKNDAERVVGHAWAAVAGAGALMLVAF